MNKIKEKIQKLMALAGGSSNEHEAASAMSKAIALMQKYQIEQSDLNKPEIVTIEKNHTKQKFSPSDTNLWAYITKALGVYYVYQQGGYGAKGIVYLTGLEYDIELCIYIYEVVMKQIDKKTKQYKWVWRLTTKQANSYKFGLVVGFGQRFVRQNTEAQESGGSTGLIPISNKIAQAEGFYLNENKKPKEKNRKDNGAGLAGNGVRDSADINYSKAVHGESQIKQIGVKQC